ncbi:DUF481 domain-containing protein [Fulvivirga sedimenti]|uniref:DUF481 domain-containing protein n=1 Tax=Fulvivirga sedimenti TaxID=2879465 RepID=A0A9X1KVM4_9BACT|nr:DUF481 domain-containing protein [Fulvivirga sedimenti]MCA6073850.1 DUF481 domain-containing protein [Fulvivirga sedimenti]
MKKNLLLLTFSLFSISLFAQQPDSIVFKNGNFIVGEIKSMDRGIIQIETDYSDSDFKIEWEGIGYMSTKSLLLVSTTDGRRLYGTIESVDNNSVSVTSVEGETTIVPFNEIVFLKSVDQGFLDRLYAAIDLGYSLTKARNQRQFTIRSSAGYIAERWSLDATYNSLSSKQDEVEDIKRTDGLVSFRYVLPREWFAIAQLDFLSNTEQLLDLRTNTKVGIGKYILRTNQYYWGFMGGVSFNNENYQIDDDDRQSEEAWFATELNLYDIGDFSLLTKATVYPSLSESNRVRFDFNIDLKYDLPLDFYIKSGLTLNYDNQPVMNATKADYVWQTTFGWEW